MNEPQPQRGFTGRGRRRATSTRALLAERVARVAITAGGMGTIVAVSLIFAFLLWVVVPLFLSPSVESSTQHAWQAGTRQIAHVATDEAGLLAWSLDQDGRIEVRSLADGALLDVNTLLESPSALSVLPDGELAAGAADGALLLGSVRFATRFLQGVEDPQLAALEPGESLARGASVVERTSADQLRETRLVASLEEPIDTESASPVRLLDQSITPFGHLFAALHGDGALRVYQLKEKENLFTGVVEKKLRRFDVPIAPRATAPARLHLSGLGQDLYVLWADGHAVHVDLRDLRAPRVLEELELFLDGESLGASGFLVGKTTLVVGDSQGAATTWFPVRGAGSDAPLVRALRLAPEEARGTPVTALAASTRSRLLLSAHADGILRLYHVTSGVELLQLEGAPAPRAVCFLPKEDGVLAWGPAGAHLWRVDLRYPETNLAGLVAPVWYEGYPAPQHVWQSSGGSDEFEPKLGLLPLVFGTIKGTVYAMLFGAPLALLAALYSSEFLKSRLRVSVKSTIELMASLPSVVLGFLAALVIAPFVEDVVPALMVALFSIPLAVLLGAYLWQLLPARLALRWSGAQRFWAIALTLPVGVLAALVLGPLWERLFFSGDVKAWLDGETGSATGGWFFLLLPVAGLLVAIACGRWVTPRVQRASAAWDRERCARFDLLKFALGVAAALALALVGGALLSSAGADPRGGVFDTYVQRNAAIVGFAMGFAIIPIIYTLAEDALSEVPGHLREGSLGAGATHWQTATRIVLPTATSGLFSAVMIGLGRAVGETMIVLMAAGNTPLMEWNAFSGFRTLSANIAVELPEAVRGSAHYRTLFLAALVLFAMTFALNTFAELVRRRFRKRARAL